MRDIAYIIKEIEIWKEAESITYEPLDGGFVNCTYKVNVDDVFYVLRINGGQNSFLKLEREKEAEVVQMACERGIAPKVYFTENKTEYLITEYKEGHIIRPDEIHDPLLIKKIAQTLINIHKLEGVQRECSPFHLIYNYLEGAKLLEVKFPEGLSDVLKEAERIEIRCNKNLKYTKKYCHNDYYTYNIINNNGNLCVIDWELSGFGDIFFDLATISFSNSFGEAEDELLLKSYFGFFEDEHRFLLHDMKYMNMLREVSWGLLHSGMEIKKINHDLDYYECALWFLDKLKDGHVKI